MRRGAAFSTADIQASKQIFAIAARNRVTPIRTIRQAVERSDDGALGEGFFLDLLRNNFSEDEARAQLDTAIGGGRYAELFEYDADTDEITLGGADNHLDRPS